MVSRNLERANENDGFKMTALEFSTFTYCTFDIVRFLRCDISYSNDITHKPNAVCVMDSTLNHIISMNKSIREKQSSFRQGNIITSAGIELGLAIPAHNHQIHEMIDKKLIHPLIYPCGWSHLIYCCCVAWWVMLRLHSFNMV